MKYHPLQLNSNLNYQESSPSKGLRNDIAFYWEINTKEFKIAYQIIPDGCVDIIFNGTTKEIFVSPTLKTSVSFDLQKNEKWFGIRFFPGKLAGWLSVKLSALQFETVALGNINQKLEKQLLEIFLPTNSFEQRVNNANQYFIKKSFETNSKVLEILSTIYKTKGGLLLKNNLDNNVFTIGERQLRRLFHQEIGVAPKSFSRIVRSQFMLNEWRHNQNSHSYFDLYFDQPHLIKDMKNLTGLTPKQILTQLF